jgi:hypothetical protein
LCGELGSEPHRAAEIGALIRSLGEDEDEDIANAAPYLACDEAA